MKRLLLLAFLAAGLTAFAQPADMKKVRMEEHWAIPHYRVNAAGQKMLQAIFSGTSADPAGDGRIRVRNFQMRSFKNGDTNQIQAIALTPECLFDPDFDNQTISSTNRIEVFTPATNFYMAGRGFFAAQSNAMLVLSNDVETRFYHELIQSNRLIPTQTNIFTPNKVLRIFSDRFEFWYTSNILFYAGHVRALDPKMQLLCERLSARFDTNQIKTNAGIQEIFAEDSVDITVPRFGRATGSLAVCNLANGEQTIELSGRARWSNGKYAAEADRFFYDHNHNQLKATGAAIVTLPYPGKGMEALGGAPSVERLPLEMQADSITIELSPTNGPPESILAENHILITNRSDVTGATGDRAYYSQTNDSVELTGNPVWRSLRGDIRSDVLSVGRDVVDGVTNAYFRTRGNSHLRIRLASEMTGQSTNSLASTNQFLEVDARDMAYETNVATFTEDVQARFIHDEQIRATFDCGLLHIFFGENNRVETLIAGQNVRAVQPPDGLILGRRLTCDTLFLHMWPGTTHIQSAQAMGHVAAQQIGPLPKEVHVRAGQATAYFSSESNAVDYADARENVHVSRTEAVGKIIKLDSQLVTYFPWTPYSVEMTGNPVVCYWTPLGKNINTNRVGDIRGICLTNATYLTLDPLKLIYLYDGSQTYLYYSPDNEPNP